MAGGSGPVSGAAAALSISTKAFDLLAQLVESRTGLHYPPDRAALLGDKLTDLVARHGLRSYLDLYYLLRYDERQDELWAEVADHLSVPETYFWRQFDQLLALQQIVPPMLESGGAVRIWSAACCSGEEPLSIAMALDVAGIPLERVQIVGSDASPRLIARAREGLFSDRAVARMPEELRDRYLTREGRGWRMDPELHRRVDWRLANLIEPGDVAPLARADIIFCRNVFIYFSDETVRRVVAAFEEAMPERGTLFLGAAESLVRVGGRLRLEEVAGAFAYRKGPPMAAPSGPQQPPSVPSARSLGWKP
jgi:chemotaxis protein methyltransferase CheR